MLFVHQLAGRIPDTMRGKEVKCAMCKHIIPVGDRLTHHDRCQRVSKTFRHDALRDEVLAKARLPAKDYHDVRGENVITLKPEVELPAEMKQKEKCRSDLSFRTIDAEGKPILVRTDFSVTCEGITGVASANIAKQQHYAILQKYAEEEFYFIPAVVSTRCMMDPRCEGFIRHVAEHYQVALAGSFSDAGTNRIVGNALARILEKELSMFSVVVGKRSRNPSVVLMGLDPIPATCIRQAGASQYQRVTGASEDVEAEMMEAMAAASE